MMRKHVERSIAIVVITLYVLVVFGEGYAADVDVTLVVNPKDTEIYAGSGKIVITADASGENLTFTWKLSGPGKIEGEGAAAFYIPPEKIEQTSEFAIVTVTVKEPSGQATIKSVTFTILPGPPKTTTPAPEPTPMVKEGMGTGTKIALGVGAVAALGGGIALAIKPEEIPDYTTKTGGPAVVGGFIWYYGASAESCTTVCASHGGYHEATRTYAGSDGTDSNCWAVLSALGAPADTDGFIHDSHGTYAGCFWINGTDVDWIRDSYTTLEERGLVDFHRACACNE